MGIIKTVSSCKLKQGLHRRKDKAPVLKKLRLRCWTEKENHSKTMLQMLS